MRTGNPRPSFLSLGSAFLDLAPPRCFKHGAPSVEKRRAAWEEGGAGGDLSLEEAEELVGLTRGSYFEALLAYRDRVGRAGSTPVLGDPVSRFVALENVLAATEAAVREAPADPFLNGLLVSTAVEHRAAMEGMAVTTTGIW